MPGTRHHLPLPPGRKSPTPSRAGVKRQRGGVRLWKDDKEKAAIVATIRKRERQWAYANAALAREAAHDLPLLTLDEARREYFGLLLPNPWRGDSGFVLRSVRKAADKLIERHGQ